MQEKDIVQFLKKVDKISKIKSSKHLKYCIEKEYLKHKNSKYIVTPKAFEFIINYEKEQERSKIENRIIKIQEKTSNIQSGTMIILIISLIVTICSAYYTGLNANATEKSAEYSYLSYQATLDSMIPNGADIKLSRYDTDTVFIPNDFISKKSFDDFKICVKNIGRMNSSQIKLKWINELGYFPVKEDSNYIDKVPAGEEICTDIPVKHYLYFTKINESAIPIGNTTLKLKIYCQNCEKQEQYYNIPICIQNRTNLCS